MTITASRDQLKKKNAANAPAWKKIMKERVTQVTPAGTVAARPMRTCSRTGIAVTSTTDADDSGVPCSGFEGTTAEVSREGEDATVAIRRYFLTRVANTPTRLSIV